MFGFLPRKKLPKRPPQPKLERLTLYPKQSQPEWDWDAESEEDKHSPRAKRGSNRPHNATHGERVKTGTTDTGPARGELPKTREPLPNAGLTTTPGQVIAKTVLSIIGVGMLGLVGFLVINGDIKLPHLGGTTPNCEASHPYYWASDGYCHTQPQQTDNEGDGVCQAGWVVTDNPSFCCPAGYTDYNDGECCEACGNPQPSWDEELGIWIPAVGCPCIVGVYPQPVR